MEIATKSCAICLGFNNVAKTYFTHNLLGSSSCITGHTDPIVDDTSDSLLWSVSKSVVRDNAQHKWATTLRFSKSVSHLLAWAMMSIMIINDPKIESLVTSVEQGTYSEAALAIHEMSLGPPASSALQSSEGEVQLSRLLRIKPGYPTGLCDIIDYDTSPHFREMVKEAMRIHAGCAPDKQQADFFSNTYSVIGNLISGEQNNQGEEEKAEEVGSTECSQATALLKLSSICSHLDSMNEDPPRAREVVMKARRIAAAMINSESVDERQLIDLHHVLSVDLDEPRMAAGTLSSCPIAGSPPNRWIAVFESLLRSLKVYDSLMERSTIPEGDKPPSSEDGSIAEHTQKAASLIINYLTLLNELTGELIMGRDLDRDPLFAEKPKRRVDRRRSASLRPMDRDAEDAHIGDQANSGVDQTSLTLIDGHFQDSCTSSIPDDVTTTMKIEATRNGELAYATSKRLMPEGQQPSMDYRNEIRLAREAANAPIRQPINEENCDDGQRKEYMRILSGMMADPDMAKSAHHHEDLILFALLFELYC